MGNKDERTLRTQARNSVTMKPSLLSEIICGLLAAVTAILIWIGSTPL